MRQRPGEISTSGGVSDTDRNALAVMPWIESPSAVVTTVTPVAKRPMTWRSWRPAASAARPAGVSPGTPDGAGGVRGRTTGSLRGRGGGIRPALAVRADAGVSLATPVRAG